ncbi:MAG: hypothetical protein R3Y50_08605 [Rikenellaceae bacterium]
MKTKNAKLSKFIDNHFKFYSIIGVVPFIVTVISVLFEIGFTTKLLVNIPKDFILSFGLSVLFVFSIIWLFLLWLFKNIHFIIRLIYFTLFLIIELHFSLFTIAGFADWIAPN